MLDLWIFDKGKGWLGTVLCEENANQGRGKKASGKLIEKLS